MNTKNTRDGAWSKRDDDVVSWFEGVNYKGGYCADAASKPRGPLRKVQRRGARSFTLCHSPSAVPTILVVRHVQRLGTFVAFLSIRDTVVQSNRSAFLKFFLFLICFFIAVSLSQQWVDFKSWEQDCRGFFLR